MIQGHVKIEKELAIKGWRRALKFRALRDISYYYAVRLVIIWLVISVVNAIWGDGRLTGYHLVALALVWVVATIVRFAKWNGEIESNTEGWEFDVTLDDDGVTSTVGGPTTEKHQWSFYKQYREYDEYLEIEDQNGNVTFLPKLPELAELVEFSKAHINAKPNW